MKPNRPKPFKYRVDIAWSDEDKCYIARVPELPGCVTDGSSLEEAAAHVKEAIAVYLETLDDQKRPHPPLFPSASFRGRSHCELVRTCTVTLPLAQ